MKDTTTSETDVAAPQKSRRFLWTVGVLVLVPLVTAGLFLSGACLDDSSQKSAEPTTTAKLSLVAAKNKPKDAEYVNALIGRWRSPESYGEITLTLKPKGKGTMYVEFSTIYSLLVDDELLIDITWKVKDGRCVFTSVKGKPQAAFDLVTKIKGRVRDQKIIKVTKDQAIFFDDKRKKTNKIWKRVQDKKNK